MPGQPEITGMISEGDRWLAGAVDGDIVTDIGAAVVACAYYLRAQAAKPDMGARFGEAMRALSDAAKLADKQLNKPTGLRAAPGVKSAPISEPPTYGPPHYGRPVEVTGETDETDPPAEDPTP